MFDYQQYSIGGIYYCKTALYSNCLIYNALNQVKCRKWCNAPISNLIGLEDYSVYFCVNKHTITMRRFLYLIISAVCFTAPICSNALDINNRDGVITHVGMHMSNQDPSVIHRSLDSGTSPFDCFIIEGINELYLVAQNTIAADVEIQNLSSGASSFNTVAISPLLTSIPLSGSGAYHITISLLDGTSYYGDFEI